MVELESFIKLGLGGAALYLAWQVVKLVFDWLKARIAPEAELDKQQTDVQKQLIESNTAAQQRMMDLYEKQMERTDELSRRQDTTQEFNTQLAQLAKQNTDYYKLLTETIQNTILDLPNQLRSDRAAIQASIGNEGLRVINEVKAQFAVAAADLEMKMAAFEQMARELISGSQEHFKAEVRSTLEVNLRSLGEKILADIQLLKEKTDPILQPNGDESHDEKVVVR